MREKFKDKSFGDDALARIDLCNEIVDEYLGQGLRLTLRQLYYQLVIRNAIPNVERSYKNLSSLVSSARLAGLIDWKAIEDRIRVPRKPLDFADLDDLVTNAIGWYKLDRWKGQTAYVELWVEKDALAGVLSPLATRHHVTMMVNRGYSSQSAMKESAERFREHDGIRDCVLLYLGDHDPSGEDMVRDIRDRFAMFGVEVDVKKIALTMGQVNQYNPPPNPAKITDPRASGYIAKYGNESWEVDALPPTVLSQLIEDSISDWIDQGRLDEVIAREERDKTLLRSAVKSVRKKK